MLTFDQAVEICEAAGMSVDIDDALAFTVCGGQLTTGGEAPPFIQQLNGEDVQSAAKAIIQATGVFP